MKVEVVTQIGGTKYIFHIDEQKEMEALHKAAVFGNPPRYCQECQNSEHFSLDSNKDKEGNTYVNIVCRQCWAKAKLGSYKVGGYFWHKFRQWSKEAVQEEL
jgi:hypothetical protein